MNKILLPVLMTLSAPAFSLTMVPVDGTEYSYIKERVEVFDEKKPDEGLYFATIGRQEPLVVERIIVSCKDNPGSYLVVNRSTDGVNTQQVDEVIMAPRGTQQFLVQKAICESRK